ncbi:hypothetical protein DFH07DRAFT_775017 [Mycena maculata]|uniref:Uncharacterized protein n=1 Tax=Mycena maculata TaxID=230809 RepID=A0AAD7IXD2_9AGAR|nr:hypothetical protein DFH07DRAFT_775017 [Mycena maculata]
MASLPGFSLRDHQARPKAKAGQNFGLALALVPKPKKLRLFGLRPKPEHHSWPRIHGLNKMGEGRVDDQAVFAQRESVDEVEDAFPDDGAVEINSNNVVGFGYPGEHRVCESVFDLCVIQIWSSHKNIGSTELMRNDKQSKSCFSDGRHRKSVEFNFGH